MVEETCCPVCGRVLRSSAPACPACLLNLALETSSDGDEPAPATHEGRDRLQTGSRVGPYTIVEELGEGGMGIVYLAEQAEPIKRRVALKVIKRGMDTEQVVKRFEAERQALALMDHVAVARVFEAGETETGRPYFAMEYIDGEAVTSYCDRKRLGTVDRLALFSRICEGVQHAHRRGIIHRDLKPSNVLVADSDGEAQPKIIDFGVAKATEQSLTEHSAMTEMGVLLGTPEYMSPEQAELAPFDIDTRTDVYSLGVLLYELLTGALPFDRRALQKAAFDEVRRHIREVRPSRPSARISQLGEKAKGMAQSRHTDVSTLGRRLAGDLDLITMKALEKERDRRYGSPAELADDIRRHLSNEPVLARAPSVVYQLRKLAARNRLASGLVGVVIVLLVAGAVVMGLQTQRIRSERDRATREARAAAEVANFLQDLFEVPDPRIAKGDDISARDVLDWGAGRIETELADQPEVQTRLMLVMGNVYNNLGVADEARRLLELGIERSRGGVEQDATHTIEGLRVLAWVHRRAGRYDEAVAAAREGLELGERFSLPDDPVLGPLLVTLGAMLRDHGELEEAQQVLDRAVEFAERVDGAESPGLGTALQHRGWLEHRLGKDEDALVTYERGCPLLDRTLGADHPRVASCLNDHFQILSMLRRHAEAADYLQRATGIWERVLPPDHPYLAETADSLGSQFYWGRDFANAEVHYRRALEMRQALYGPDHPEVGASLHNVALALREMGRYEEAEEHFLRSIPIAEAALGRDDDRVHNELNNLAELYINRGRFAEALRLQDRIATTRERTKGPDHLWLAGALGNKATSLLQLGRLNEAEAALHRALEIAAARTGWESQGRASIAVDLARCYTNQGRVPDAYAILREMLDAMEQAEIKNPARARAYYLLARIARLEGDRDRVDALLEQALNHRREFQAENHRSLLFVQAAHLAHKGETDRAIETLRKSLEAGLLFHVVDTKFGLAPLLGHPDFEALLAEYDPN